MNWKKGIAVALSAITVMAMVAGCGSNTTTSDQKKIGVIQLVEHPSLDAANKGFVDGLASKGFKDGENIKIDQQNAQADQSNLNSIAQRFVSDKKDLVLAIASPAAQTRHRVFRRRFTGTCSRHRKKRTSRMARLCCPVRIRKGGAFLYRRTDLET